MEMVNTGSDYNVVLGSNLIDRLSEPLKWINLAKQKVSKDGIVIICDPSTWLDEFTAIDKWIGGFKKDAENYYTKDGLYDAFGPEFTQIDSGSVPFVI